MSTGELGLLPSANAGVAVFDDDAALSDDGSPVTVPAAFALFARLSSPSPSPLPPSLAARWAWSPTTAVVAPVSAESGLAAPLLLPDVTAEEEEDPPAAAAAEAAEAVEARWEIVAADDDFFLPNAIPLVITEPAAAISWAVAWRPRRRSATIDAVNDGAIAAAAPAVALAIAEEEEEEVEEEEGPSGLAVAGAGWVA